MKKIIALSFVFLLLLSSCSDKGGTPRGILPKEKMQAVLWDMISAAEFLNGYVLNKDSVNKLAESSKIYGRVFQVNHITREEFDKSYSYYRGHPELMQTMLDSLGKKRAPVIPSPPPIKKDSVNSLKKKISAQKL
ncbi:MAG: DUF4296 domain-containing protein [Bacteroidota bacterium]|nr:DUF4296 domain-containing protein [Bacteroidota bacterium]